MNVNIELSADGLVAGLTRNAWDRIRQAVGRRSDIEHERRRNHEFDECEIWDDLLVRVKAIIAAIEAGPPPGLSAGPLCAPPRIVRDADAGNDADMVDIAAFEQYLQACVRRRDWHGDLRPHRARSLRSKRSTTAR
jgi:hypothetical protein